MNQFNVINNFIFINYMKILLFGSTGMLGNYVKLVLSKNYHVICINRNNIEKTYKIVKFINKK